MTQRQIFDENNLPTKSSGSYCDVENSLTINLFGTVLPIGPTKLERIEHNGLR